MAAHEDLPSGGRPRRRRRENQDSFGRKIRREHAHQPFRHPQRSLAVGDGNNGGVVAQVDQALAGTNSRTGAPKFLLDRAGDIDGGKSLAENALSYFFHALSIAEAPARATSES